MMNVATAKDELHKFTDKVGEYKKEALEMVDDAIKSENHEAFAMAIEVLGMIVDMEKDTHAMLGYPIEKHDEMKTDVVKGDVHPSVMTTMHPTGEQVPTTMPWKDGKLTGRGVDTYASHDGVTHTETPRTVGR